MKKNEPEEVYVEGYRIEFEEDWEYDSVIVTAKVYLNGVFVYKDTTLVRS